MVGHPYVMENAAPELYQYGTICQPIEADGAYLKVMDWLKRTFKMCKGSFLNKYNLGIEKY